MDLLDIILGQLEYLLLPFMNVAFIICEVKIASLKSRKRLTIIECDNKAKIPRETFLMHTSIWCSNLCLTRTIPKITSS
jgi:hypothetical protein